VSSPQCIVAGVCNCIYHVFSDSKFLIGNYGTILWLAQELLTLFWICLYVRVCVCECVHARCIVWVRKADGTMLCIENCTLGINDFLVLVELVFNLTVCSHACVLLSRNGIFRSWRKTLKIAFLQLVVTLALIVYFVLSISSKRHDSDNKLRLSLADCWVCCHHIMT
jgi:hypothetical protein